MLGYCTSVIASIVLCFAAYTATAAPRKPVYETWFYMGDERRPISLRQCPKSDTGVRITINYNSGINTPWRRFCYRTKPRDTKT